jgi:hypothetical protein
MNEEGDSVDALGRPFIEVVLAKQLFTIWTEKHLAPRDLPTRLWQRWIDLLEVSHVEVFVGVLNPYLHLRDTGKFLLEVFPPLLKFLRGQCNYLGLPADTLQEVFKFLQEIDRVLSSNLLIDKRVVARSIYRWGANTNQMDIGLPHSGPNV